MKRHHGCHPKSLWFRGIISSGNRDAAAIPGYECCICTSFSWQIYPFLCFLMRDPQVCLVQSCSILSNVGIAIINHPFGNGWFIPTMVMIGGWFLTLLYQHWSGWWFQALRKIWVRQLGWWTSQLNGKIKVMFQSPPTRQKIPHPTGRIWTKLQSIHDDNSGNAGGLGCRMMFALSWDLSTKLCQKKNASTVDALYHLWIKTNIIILLDILSLISLVPPSTSSTTVPQSVPQQFHSQFHQSELQTEQDEKMAEIFANLWISTWREALMAFSRGNSLVI